MKAYLFVTGVLFGLLGVAHLVRLVAEGDHSLSADPQFLAENIGIFLVGAGFAFWAFRLTRALGLRERRDGAGRNQ